MTIKQRLLTAAVLGIAAMACLWLYADEVALQAAGGAKVDVLVAATDLPPGKRLVEGEELLQSRREEVDDQVIDYIEASSYAQKEREEETDQRDGTGAP